MCSSDLGKDGSTGEKTTEFYTLTPEFIKEHRAETGWQKVRLRGLEDDLKPFRDDAGFELIAQALGVERPRKVR